MTPRRVVVEAELNGLASGAEIVLLESDLEAWEQELISMVEQFQADIASMSQSYEEEIAKYESINEDDLARILRDTRDTTIRQMIAKRIKVERKLMDVSRRKAASERSLDPVTNLYRQAIERHKAKKHFPDVTDKALWATLEGKWLFE